MPEAAEFEELFAQAEAHMQRWELEDATRLLEGALAAGEVPNRLHHDLSILQAQQGFFAAALASIERAMAGDPRNRAVWHHFLALQKNNPAQPSPAQWRAMHLGFGDTLRERADRRYRDEPRQRAPGGRLRVGYLCPDTHRATERFVWPVLEHFDAAAFEVTAYWCHAPETHRMEQAYPRARHRAIRGLDDEALASLLVADGIDIAVDVAGHGAGNVLPVLALKPAPVRITWLDYLATTGLEAVDFRITDAVADPPGAEAAHVEKLLRLEVPPWCYRPPPEAAPGDAAPANASGDPVTFGSVCVPLKLSETVLDLWARLLARVPGSRIRFLGIPEGRARERIAGRLTEAGVAPERIELMGRLSEPDFLRALTGLDIVLDSHPFSGATSTLDALWQGVPVVTLAGELSHGRSSASILTALGRGEWVAETPARFLEIAAALAGDRARLRTERAVLRGELRASVLCDGPRFARETENAYRHAWSTALERTEAVPRESAQVFWRDFQQSLVPGAGAVARTPVTALGDEWIWLSDARFYDAGAVPLAIPDALLGAFDVLGPLGADAMRTGELLAAGPGHVRGVSLLGEAGGARFFCSLYLPEGFGRCVALSGPVLLVRRSVLGDMPTLIEGAPDEPAFRAQLTRLSHELYRRGARLGVSAALAIPERSTVLDLRAEFAAQRGLERDLGLPRWSQERPAPVPLKAAFPARAWPTILPAIERLCDSRDMAG